MLKFEVLEDNGKLSGAYCPGERRKLKKGTYGKQKGNFGNKSTFLGSRRAHWLEDKGFRNLTLHPFRLVIFVFFKPK